MSYLIAYISAYFNAYGIMSTILILTGGIMSLTAYSFIAKNDISNKYGFYCGNLGCFAFFLLAISYSSDNIVATFYCFMVSIFACCFVFYDSLLIAGGRFEDLKYDDYNVSSIMVYLDVVGIFVYIIHSAIVGY
jgi:FtsH-binding integral membrane protein